MRVWLVPDDGTLDQMLNLNDELSFWVNDRTLSVFNRPGEISFALSIEAASGADQTTLDAHLQRLWDVLNTVMRQRTRLLLALQPSGSELVQYADVLAGGFSLPAGVLSAAAFVSSVYDGVPLSFQCLPYLRGAPVRSAWTSTVVNGISSTLFIPRVPGTAPALAIVEIEDRSTSGMVLQRMRVAWHGWLGMQAGDWTPFMEPTAVSPATSGAEAGTSGGTRVRLAAATSEYQAIADFASTERGPFGLLVRGRDSSAGVTAKLRIKKVVTSGGGGLSGPKTYSYFVAARNGSDVIAVSGAATISIRDTGTTFRNTVTHTTVSGATDYDIYWREEPNAYQFLSQGNTLGAYSHSNPVGTTQDPPAGASGAVRSGLLQAAGLMPAGDIVRHYDPAPFRFSNGQWEWLWALDNEIPAFGRGESALSDAGVTRVLGRSGGTGTPNLDVDMAAWMARGPGQYAEMWYRTDDLAALSFWILDPDRAGTQRAYLTDSGGIVTGVLDRTPGPLEVDPGIGALFTFVGDGVGGGAGINTLQYAVRVTLIPRYQSLGAIA